MSNLADSGSCGSMSDLAIRLATSAASHRPIAGFLVLPIPRKLLEAEQQLLFARGPGYVGHELMVPNAGDYHTLAVARQCPGAGAQRRRASSCCPTSAATARRSCSRAAATRRTSCARCTAGPTTSKASCSARRISTEKPCVKLHSTPLKNWNGLLFDGPRDVAARPGGHRRRPAISISRGYVLDRVEIHECNYNWKTFIEVYLEDYHVGPFHPGLGQFVTCDDCAGSSATATRCRRWA